jgi:acetyl esterase/lipase
MLLKSASLLSVCFLPFLAAAQPTTTMMDSAAIRELITPTVSVIADTIRDPASQRIALYTFRPSGATAALPCVLFCPAYGADNPIEYQGFINRIAHCGALVVFPTYAGRSFTRRSVEIGLRTDEVFGLLSRVVRSSIDTSRIGFIGHSYGAGILPSIAERIIDREGWGGKGAFMYMMSPWYFPGISERELAHFPTNCGVVVQVFERDNINDPRIGSYFFQMLKLPPDRKEFYVVCVPQSMRGLKCDFRVPQGREAPGGADDILDTLALYRTVDSLCAGVFKGQKSAFTFVFGSGKTRRIPLGAAVDTGFCMVGTENPKPFLSRLPYINSWISPRNPFVDVSAFRRARRMGAGFKRQKISNALGYAIDKKKKEDADDATDILIIPNPIDSGFGADGAYGVRVDSILNPLDKASFTFLFTPDSVDGTPLPFIVLLHGYTGQDRFFFEPYISHVVSRGVAVIYPTYPILPVASSAQRVEEKIAIVKSGIAAGLDMAGGRLDTSRVGVQGQSFGGGMAPAIGWDLFKAKGWGTTGAFLYCTAPWYCHGISQAQLDSFPPRVSLVMMVFDDDAINDHQMAVDIFSYIGIPASGKNFITLMTDSIDGAVMRADHFVPYGTHYIYGQENLLDYYGVYRFSDALAAYQFYGDESGRRIALGSGDSAQCFMGRRADGTLVRPCRMTDTPVARHAENDYFYPWFNPLNPRLKLDNSDSEADSIMLRLRKR